MKVVFSYREVTSNEQHFSQIDPLRNEAVTGGIYGLKRICEHKINYSKLYADGNSPVHKERG